jgi:predicted protein tyrosine phosphatase
MQSTSGVALEPPRDGGIYVCSLAALDEAVKHTRASHLVTLINAQMMAELKTPSGVSRHLRLVLNDIITPIAGMISPSAEHVRDLIAFAHEWDQLAPLLINCHAGRRRSTAAAFIISCALNPEASEEEIAASLRQASANAEPNRLLVRYADEMLGRNGRMTAAIDKIGKGDPAHNTLFRFPFANHLLK